MSEETKSNGSEPGGLVIENVSWDEKTRNHYGRVVRNAWISWAKSQPDPKHSWLVPFDELSEADKEADRLIAETVVNEWLKRVDVGEEPVMRMSDGEGETYEIYAQDYGTMEGEFCD